jgi:uncharacterized repeat protein (TIGR03803 family)
LSLGSVRARVQRFSLVHARQWSQSVFRESPSGVTGTSYGTTFAGGDFGGGTVYGTLYEASDGNLYGMTVGGGDFGYGTVYRIIPAEFTPDPFFRFHERWLSRRKSHRGQ